jgi:Ner family transcriptional regulator
MIQQDWHPADIIASLSVVSHNAGLASSTLINALNRCWPPKADSGSVRHRA